MLYYNDDCTVETPLPVISAHTQRTDALAVLPDGTRAAICASNDRGLFLVIGDQIVSLNTLANVSEVLGIRALGRFVATLSNPVVLMHKAPTPGGDGLRLFPTSMFQSTPADSSDRMVNTLFLFHEGRRICMFVGTNAGNLLLTRVKAAFYGPFDMPPVPPVVSCKRLALYPVSVNDMDVRFDQLGHAIILMVFDSNVVSVSEYTVGCQNDADVHSAVRECCRMAPEGMQSCFTYCAIG